MSDRAPLLPVQPREEEEDVIQFVAEEGPADGRRGPAGLLFGPFNRRKPSSKQPQATASGDQEEVSEGCHAPRPVHTTPER